MSTVNVRITQKESAGVTITEKRCRSLKEPWAQVDSLIRTDLNTPPPPPPPPTYTQQRRTNLSSYFIRYFQK